MILLLQNRRSAALTWKPREVVQAHQSEMTTEKPSPASPSPWSEMTMEVRDSLNKQSYLSLSGISVLHEYMSKTALIKSRISQEEA